MLCSGGKVPRSFQRRWGQCLPEHRAQRSRGRSDGRGLVHRREGLGGSSQAGASWYGSPWQPLLAPLPCGHLGWGEGWPQGGAGVQGLGAGWAIPDQAAQQPQAPAGSSSRTWGGAGRPPQGPLAKAEPPSAGPGPRSVVPSSLVEAVPLGREKGHPRGPVFLGWRVGPAQHASSPGHLSVCAASGSGLVPHRLPVCPSVLGRARPPGGRSPAWPATSPSAAS